MYRFWRHSRISRSNSINIFHSKKAVSVKHRNRILTQISTIKIFRDNLQKPTCLWTSKIMDGAIRNSVESTMENTCSNVKRSCECDSVRQDDNDDRLSASSQPQTDSGCSSFNLKFDMAKIVDDVKIRMRKKRKDKNTQEKVSGTGQFGNDSFGFHSLFGESSLSCEEGIKEKNGRPKSTKSASNTDQSDNDLLGLQSLFEETETKNKTTKKKERKVKKYAGEGKNPENESFGLELLFNENKRKEYRRKRKLQENNSENDDESGKEIVNRKKPNYFVAIRVSNPQIHDTVKDFQASILKENDKLKPTLIPLPSLHLTMAVMHLDGVLTDVAKGALEKCQTKINEILERVNFKLKFLGVGNFKNEVVFAKVWEEKHLESLKAINHVITAAFEDEGICVHNEKEWKAHLTLLKLSKKPALRRKGIKKVKEEVYALWTDSYFGEEQVTNMYLCSMFEPKEKDGFYKCAATISLGKTNEEATKAWEDLLGEDVIQNVK